CGDPRLVARGPPGQPRQRVARGCLERPRSPGPARFRGPHGGRPQGARPARPLGSDVERSRQRPRRRASRVVGFRGRGQGQEPRLRASRPACRAATGRAGASRRV
ncbi:MAG: UV DNA damage endonuclease (EC (UV-endonuclease) (UVED), partial [uncultured Microvirga sp.]